MSRMFLFALILAGSLASARDACPERRPGRITAPRSQPTLFRLSGDSRLSNSREKTVSITRTRIVLSRRLPAPPPVGAPPSAGPGTTIVEGILPNIILSRTPLQMVNPLAPPEYGSARNLVVYTEEDPYDTVTNKIRFQPYGIRVLTVRPLW